MSRQSANLGTEDIGRRLRPFGVVVALATLALVAAACVPPQPATGPSPSDAPRAGDAAYSDHGPFGVGVTTVELSDRQMEVWYPVDPGDIGDAPGDSYRIRDFVSSYLDGLIDPAVDPVYQTDAARDVPASAEGPFPLVLFAHGFASFRQQSSFLTTHLASWGFVVISPDFLDRGLKAVLGEPPAVSRSDKSVVDEAINTTRALTTADAGLLSGVVDASRVFPVGHSAGGGTAVQMLDRSDVPSAIPLASGYFLAAASAGRLDIPLDKPVMWIGAQNDHIASIDDIRLGFQMTAGQRKLIELRDSGHLNAFSDICDIGDGGIVAIARAASLPIPEFLLQLGNDGCPVPLNRPSHEIWPEVRHFVTAELRYRSGIDAQPVGLGDQVLARFDDVATYKHNP
ncbi:MAG: dienelactone hydrolase family protein [Microthrixaceae bacterium]